MKRCRLLTCIILLDYGSKMREYGKNCGGHLLAKKAYPRPWVARCSKHDGKKEGKKEFVKGFTDHALSNADGSRPVSISFMVEIGGRYEVFESLPKGGGIWSICEVTRDGEFAEVASLVGDRCSDSSAEKD